MAAKTKAARLRNAKRAGLISMGMLSPAQRRKKARHAAMVRWAMVRAAQEVQREMAS